jgi:hypothetical protein
MIGAIAPLNGRTGGDPQLLTRLSVEWVGCEDARQFVLFGAEFTLHKG